MALPGDVSTFTISFGHAVEGYTDATGAIALLGKTGKLYPVDVVTGKRINLVHIATGQAILPTDVEIVLDEGGKAKATVGPLPHTDNAGLSVVGFGYHVEWNIPSGSHSATPKDKTFAAPAVVGATVDYDLLDAAEAVPGVLVPVQTTPTGGAGGALSGSYPNPGLNSTAVTAAVAPQFSRRGDANRPAGAPFAGPNFQPAGTIFTVAEAGSGTIYTPFIVDMQGIPGALGRWHLYWSTDHGIAGGIYLAYTNDIDDPDSWTVRGLVYVDTTLGSQTETPCVLIVPDDPDGLPVYVYYQQKGVGTNQSTCLARSADGVTFVRYGIVLEQRYRNPGDGSHTYARVHRIGGTFVAYHLIGQGDWAGMGISWSHDGRRWRGDPRRLTPRPDITGSNTTRFNWHGLLLFWWRGRLWGHTGISDLVSGTETSPVTPLFVAMAPGLRDISGDPIVASMSISSVVEHEGTLHAVWQNGSGPTATISYAKAVA